MTDLTIEKRRYGTIYDYVITFENESSLDIPEFAADSWVSIRINKALKLDYFKPILAGYSTHRFYRDPNYYLFFNKSAKECLPIYNPTLKLHEHVSLKIKVGNQSLKVKSRYSNSWRILSGGVKYKESPDDAVKRELYEELGIICDTPILTHTRQFNMSIPILNKPIKTKMYYYHLELDSLPDIKMDKNELSEVKLGNNIICS